MIQCPIRTEQEAFNLVWEKLNAQGEPSVLPGGQCACSSPKGHCAAGHLLPWDTMTPAQVEQMALSNRIEATEIDDVSWGVNRSFLAKLQHAHDQAVRQVQMLGQPWLENWRQRMRLLAISQNLTVPETP